MKIIKYISIVMVLIIGVTQCKLPDNIDPKNPTEVPIETLFTNAEVALINQVDEVNVNLNTTRLLVQYHQQTTYFDESRYLFLDRQIPDNYTNEFYRDALIDLKRTKELLIDWGGNASEKANKIAITTILEVYAWQCIVDAFGDMPYSEALLLNENSQPAYDDAATIYASIISELGTAMSTLNTGAASFGGADVLFGGDVASWKRFGASLQVRLGMRLADVNAATAKATVEAGIANGIFTSQDQSASLVYNGVVPNVNAIYNAFTVDGRADYLPTNTIIDLMNSLDDPRRPLYFTTVDDGSGNNIYLGAVAGLDGAQVYQGFSNFSAPFFAPTFPAILQDFVEVEFLLAEATERGFIAGSAGDHYNHAIEASILYWGGTQAEVDTYLARTDVAYNSANWKELIGTQKYIALYNRGVEAWAEWRRLDFPALNIPEGMTANDLPMRYPYPYNEVLNNQASYEAAVAKMGGTDDRRQKLFWDVN